MPITRRIVFTGPGRSGTAWLAQVLPLLLPPGFEVEHEPFNQEGLPHTAAAWINRAWMRDRSWVLVSHYARDAIDQLAAVADSWVMIWRNPDDVLRSYLTRRTFTSQFGANVAPGTRLRVLARQQYGDLAATLGLLRLADCDVQHVLFEQACDPGPGGLRGLLGDLGLRVPAENLAGTSALPYPPPANATPGELVIDAEQFSLEDLGAVRRTVRGLPQVAGAIRSARDRFATMYEREPPPWTWDF